MMEAASVTGPAKNLLGFCRWLNTPEGAETGLSVAIATFDRNARAYESESFAGAARAAPAKLSLSYARALRSKVAMATLRPVSAPSGVLSQRQKPRRFFAGPVTEAASIIARIRTRGGSFTRLAARLLLL